MHRYLQALQTYLDTGQATEQTYRPALQTLLEESLPDCRIIHEPRRSGPNAVDFIARWDEVTLGWIETKDIGANLDTIQQSEQLQRYRGAQQNLILTDYLEFRYFYRGELQADMTVRLAELRDGRLQIDENAFAGLRALLTRFSLAEALTLNSPPELARQMAETARLIAYAVLSNYQAEDKNGNFHSQLHSFRSVLLDSLQPVEFADMYAQTVCYGLFAAKCTLIGEKLSRYNAAHSIPKTNPFLRHLFDQIAGIDMDERLAWAVEHLIEILNYTDMAAILADFGKRTRREDPVVHFYETFLAAYDPALREVRGVYYTPEPVVSYIVRSLDEILQSHFGLKEGLACREKLPEGIHQVQILDPATGTGTFIYALFNLIHERFLNKQGIWRSYVSEHLLPRVHGFEFLMAPYTVAHMKLGLQLQETGYAFESDERLRLFLTNTLEDAHADTQTLMARWLSEEANAANTIKSATPVMVILGNPPYSGHSANPNRRGNQLTAIGEKLLDYYQVDGKPLGEKNPKWLQDDYVKFIRFAQWKIEQTGYGALGFVTNHGYLDNPTFRGMRHSLMRAFDEIYILDLHGNSKKKEKSPDGAPDKNVFDIQQGVAIGIFIKHQRKNLPGLNDLTGLAQVFHAELWGNRAGKYTWLYEHKLSSTAWTALQPDAPFYLFKPQNTELRQEYEEGWKLTEMMPVNSWGIATRKDYLLIDFDRQKLISKFKDIKILDTDKAIFKYNIKTAPHWSFRDVHKQLSKTTENLVRKILFRPFDIRFIYYEKCMIERGDHRFPLMYNMQYENIALITTRRIESGVNSGHFNCTNMLSVLHSTSAKEGNFVFPLYIYPQNGHANGDTTNGALELEKKRRVNFSLEFIRDLEEKLNAPFSPEGGVPGAISAEQVFYYMYAVFHSPAYRARYADFLKMDFPRLPLTSDRQVFLRLAEAGAELASIHLMEAHLAETAGYPVDGNNRVDNPAYRDGRIYINQAQYFAPVALAVWEFYIGGYQVAHKWLKDRKGRELNYDDVEHYLYILAALQKTLEWMEKIDDILPGFPLH